MAYSLAMRSMVGGAAVRYVAPARPDRLNPELIRMSGLVLDLLKKNKSQILSNQARAQDILPQLNIDGLSNREIKELLLKGHGIGNYSKNDLSRINRGMSSVLLTNPKFWGDTYEHILSKNLSPEDARKYLHIQQRKLEMWGGLFRVGHHGISLSSLSAPIEALQGYNPRTQQLVLHLIEQQTGIDLGENSLLFIPTLAHGMNNLTSLRADFAKALNAKDLDEVNPALKQLLKTRIAHAESFKGTKGFEASVNAIKGLTKPEDIAKALIPYVSAEWAGADQALRTTEVLNKYIDYEKGTVNKEAFLPGGALEQDLMKVPETRVNKPNTYNKDIFARPKDMFKGPDFSGPKMTKVIGSDVPLAQPEYDSRTGLEIGASRILEQENRSIENLQKAGEVILEGAVGDHPAVVGAQAGIQVGQGKIPTTLLKTKLVTDTPLPDYQRKVLQNNNMKRLVGVE